VFAKVMGFFADGTIKPPHASKLDATPFDPIASCPAGLCADTRSTQVACAQVLHGMCAVLLHWLDAKYSFACTGVKFSLDKAAEAVKKAMDGVGGQGKVMLEDKFELNEE
jgi:hypothetical protein